MVVVGGWTDAPSGFRAYSREAAMRLFGRWPQAGYKTNPNIDLGVVPPPAGEQPLDSAKKAGTEFALVAAPALSGVRAGSREAIGAGDCGCD